MNAPRRWAAVIVAAGRGTRFGSPKQFLELAGLPMVGWSLQTFARMPEIEEIAIATEPESLEPMRELAERIAPGRVGAIVAGGSSRQGSSYHGVRAVSEACDGVFVHDGARPLVRDDDVRAGMAEVRDGRGALLAAPAIDTIKVVDASTRRVRQTLDRATLWAAQTPQFATRADLLRAHERARETGAEVTDDAALLESIGVDVVVVAASSENFKVTLPEDVARAEAFLRERIVS
ncbi:MAG: 2-C-methyl-D-erythritol 4-phosphate cytidylyltransferase [Candidatus Eremiobacteraeota bacterium]|nr:2-C-methyl-D-erythritol 4-phosphate cytidylyltransferase [Candidatus Eremiobacteraeota bacterium]